MVRAYSNDLRERVAASVALGRTCRETADLFGVSVSSAVKWSQRRRSTGTAAALPMGGSRGRSLAAHRDWLLKRMTGPGMTVQLLAVELRDQGIAANPTSIWRALKEAGFSFKKTLFASEQDPPAIARRREQWRMYQGRVDPRRLVFIDETWVKTNVAPLRGWGPRGRKLIAKAPHGHWRTLTFLAALRHDRIEAPCVIDGPINGEAFRAYVEQLLVPTDRFHHA